MTSPGAVERARVGVRALPDTSVFARSLERYLQRVEHSLRVELPVVLDDSGVDAEFARIRQRLEAEGTFALPTVLDEDELARQRDRYRKETESAPPVEIPVSAENPIDAEFRRRMQAELRKLTGQMALVIPTSPQEAELRRRLGAEIAEIERQLKVEVPVEPSAAATFRAKVRAQVAAAQAAVPPIRTELEPDLDESDVVALHVRVQLLARRLSGAEILFDVAPDRDSVARLTADIAKLGGALSALGLGTLAGSAAAGSLVALAGAISQAVGAIALLPAAGAAGAAALGALVIGFQGVGDAIKADDPKAWAEALANLSPEAREAAVAVKDLADEFRTARMAVQDQLFAGVAEQVRELAVQLLPSMQRGLTGVAHELNLGSRAFAEFAASPQAVSSLDRIFANVKEAFHALVPAGADFAAALTNIADVGSNFLPSLGEGLSEASTQFRNFIAESAKSGALEAFIQRALDTIKQLGRIIADIGAGLGNIFSAGQERGASLLTVIEQLSQEFRDFTASAEGQQAFGDFFQAASKAAAALMPVLGSLVELIGSTVAPILAEVGTIVGPAVVTVLDSLGEALRIAQPGIAAFAGGFAALLTGLAPALPAIGELVSVLGTSLGRVLEDLGPILAEVATVLAGALAEALSNDTLLDGIVAMAEAFGDLLIALAPSLPQLAQLGGVVLKGLAQMLERIAPVLGDLVAAFVSALAPVLPQIVDAMLALVDAMAPIAFELGTAFIEIFKVLGPLLPPIVTVLATFMAILTPLAELLGWVIGLIGDAIGWIADMADAAIGTMYELMGMEGTITGSLSRANEDTKLFGKESSDALGWISTAAEGTGAALEKSSQTGSFWLGSLAESSESASQRLQDAQNAYIKQIETSLIPSFFRMRDAGTSSFWSIATAAAGAADATVNEARKLAENARAVLASVSFHDQGARLGQSLADGLVSSVTLSAIRSAANRMISEVAAYLPNSPALAGPFSGRGWTPYRGQAIADGLAAGMLARVDAVRSAAAQLADAASSSIELPAGVGAGGGGRGDTYNVYASEGQSPESIATQVSQQVAWNARTA